jgi:DNA-binding transcriptional MerR regulator
MTAPAEQRTLRIGEVAERLGVTTRTIRYYEERGLLGPDASRQKGSHRLYTGDDVDRLEELIRLRDLLSLSLDEVVEFARAEEARAGLRDRWEGTTSDDDRLRIVDAALPLVERQLGLVRARQAKLDKLAGELETKLRALKRRRRQLTL